jgi:hypothetical protein
MKFMGMSYDDLRTLPVPYYHEIVKIINEENDRIDNMASGLGT